MKKLTWFGLLFITGFIFIIMVAIRPAALECIRCTDTPLRQCLFPTLVTDYSADTRPPMATGKHFNFKYKILDTGADSSDFPQLLERIRNRTLALKNLALDTEGCPCVFESADPATTSRRELKVRNPPPPMDLEFYVDGSATSCPFPKADSVLLEAENLSPGQPGNQVNTGNSPRVVFSVSTRPTSYQIDPEALYYRMTMHHYDSSTDIVTGSFEFLAREYNGDRLLAVYGGTFRLEDNE